MRLRSLGAGFFAALWLALSAAAAGAADEVALPVLSARVTDLTGTLEAEQTQRLETLLAGIEQQRGAQIAVLLLPSTQPETIEQFGIRLAEAWKLGHQGRDDGVMVIVAKADRKMRIEVGYGLEGAIPDAVAKRIVAERMAPRFKQGDFAGGLIDAAEALEQAIVAGAAPPAAGAEATPAEEAGGEDPEKFPWLFATLIFGGVLRLLFGIFGSLAAAGVGGWLAFVVFGSLPLAAGAAVLAFLFSFVNVFSGGRGGGWSSGGGFSSGGGGFSGGGGGFGGGGASGDW